MHTQWYKQKSDGTFHLYSGDEKQNKMHKNDGYQTVTENDVINAEKQKEALARTQPKKKTLEERVTALEKLI